MPATLPIKIPLEPADLIKLEPFLGIFSTICITENNFIEYNGKAHPKILLYVSKASSKNSGLPEYITSLFAKLLEAII